MKTDVITSSCCDCSAQLHEFYLDLLPPLEGLASNSVAMLGLVTMKGVLVSEAGNKVEASQ